MKPFTRAIIIVGTIVTLSLLFGKPANAATYAHKIEGPIYGISQYYDLIDTLYTAKKDDVVVIKVTSTGGSVWVMNKILRAMDASKAYIKVHVISHAYSAAAMITFNADEIALSPGSDVLFHFGSITWKRTVDVMDAYMFLLNHIKSSIKLFDKLVMKETGKFPLMTEQELNAMLNNVDIVLTEEEVKRRLGNVLTAK